MTAGCRRQAFTDTKKGMLQQQVWPPPLAACLRACMSPCHGAGCARGRLAASSPDCNLEMWRRMRVGLESRRVELSRDLQTWR